MKKLSIFLLCLLPCSGLFAQYYPDVIDSTIAGIKLGEGDWAIALCIQHAGAIPVYDSPGNLVEEDPDGTYIITQINKHCTLRKFDLSYSNNIQPVLTMSKLINITDRRLCAYTRDSIQKAGTEWIYPNIYRNDSLKVYSMQPNGNHDFNFSICFRTSESKDYINFGAVDIFNFWSQKPERTNLNYEYNTGTIIYRIFMNVIDYLQENFKYRVRY